MNCWSKVHYGMKSYRYEPGRAENSIPPDCYFCLYSALPLLLFCLCLSWPSCLYTYCVQYVVWFPGSSSCAYCSQKKQTNKQNTKQRYPTIPLHSPPSLFLISYYEQIFQILFLLCMYSIAIARLSHKPSWAGCISCRWHSNYWLIIDWLMVNGS